MQTSNSYLKTYRQFRKSVSINEAIRLTLDTMIADFDKEPKPRKLFSVHNAYVKLWKAFAKKALNAEYVVVSKETTWSDFLTHNLSIFNQHLLQQDMWSKNKQLRADWK